METVEIEGEFVDQENGITTIKAKIEDVLEQIDLFTIKETLDLYSKDEAHISWFDDYDIEQEYEDRDLGDEPDTWDNVDMIQHLEDVGYTVLTEDELDNGLDYIDQKRLDEITDLFLRGSFQEREEIYKTIIK